MKNILIDANIYLEFYQSSRIGQLLPTIEKCAEHIFLTTQIVSEVQRNQLGVATKFLESSYPKKEPQFGIPKHLVALGEGLPKRVDDFNNTAKALTIELKAAYEKSLGQIACSSDEVTKSLATLFAKQVAPKESELAQASRRKHLGNPPGKPNDPLGDQLTWEQFLAQAKGGKKFWIITKDSDYCEEILNSKVPTLNPFLKNELVETCGNDVAVYCFRTLGEGLKDFTSQMGVADPKLPEKAVLDEIVQEENLIKHDPYNSFESSPPSICPKCDARDSFRTSSFLRSQFGGLTLQYRCHKCGFLFDTGDFFD